MVNPKAIADILLSVVGPRNTTSDASLVFQVVEKTLTEVGDIYIADDTHRRTLAQRLAANSVQMNLCRETDLVLEPIYLELSMLLYYESPTSAALYKSEWHLIHTMIKQRVYEIDRLMMSANPSERVSLLDERKFIVGLKEELFGQVN